MAEMIAKELSTPQPSPQQNGPDKPQLPDLSSIQNKDKEPVSQQPSTQPLPVPTQNQLQEYKPQQVPAYDDVIKKRSLIMTITRYLIEFQDYLPPDLIGQPYSQLSIEELANLLTEIKFCIATRNATNMSTRAMKQAITVTEPLLCRVGLRVQGLSGICNDKDFNDTLREFTLENMNLFYTKPVWRLAYAMTMAIANLHMVNTRKEKEEMQNKIKQEPSQEQKYVDLKFEDLLEDISAMRNLSSQDKEPKEIKI